MLLLQSCCSHLTSPLLKHLLCQKSFSLSRAGLPSSRPKRASQNNWPHPALRRPFTVKTIRTAVISCTFLFALGAFAQYPAGGQATQPMQPQAQQPGMQPAQPSTQPSQAQPGQDQNAQPGQQPGAATQPQSPSAAGHPSIDDQVQSLAQQLNLS